MHFVLFYFLCSCMFYFVLCFILYFVLLYVLICVLWFCFVLFFLVNKVSDVQCLDNTKLSK